jgi:hypothetical protein
LLFPGHRRLPSWFLVTDDASLHPVSSSPLQFPPISGSIRQFPAVSANFRQFPAVSANFRQFPAVSASFRQFPASSFRQFRQFPDVSAHFRQFPPVSASFRTFPPISGSFRQFPASSFQQFPPVSGSFHQFPAVSGRFRQLPAVSGRFQQFPAISPDRPNTVIHYPSLPKILLGKQIKQNMSAHRQQYIPPPPPPFDNAPARGYSPYQQSNGREPPPMTHFAGRSPTPGAFDRQSYGVLEADRRNSIHKTPLQSRHFEKLTKASQFHTWEKRVKSAISSIPGNDQLLNNFNTSANTSIQEQILNFLIQTVYDPEGFDILCTIENIPFEEYSTRGRDAWHALRDHYHQVNGARISELLADFNCPQQPHESGSTFITRVINKRLEIKQAGIEVPHNHARLLMMEGLREEYKAAISFLRVAEFESSDTMKSKLVQICNSIDKRQKGVATANSTWAHFGSAKDAFDYHQPRQQHPHSVRGGRNIIPNMPQFQPQPGIIPIQQWQNRPINSPQHPIIMKPPGTSKSASYSQHPPSKYNSYPPMPIYKPATTQTLASVTGMIHNNPIYASSHFPENDENYYDVNVTNTTAVNSLSASPPVPAIAPEKTEFGEDLSISSHFEVVMQSAIHNNSDHPQQKSPKIAKSFPIPNLKAAGPSSTYRLHHATTTVKFGSELTNLCPSDGDIPSPLSQPPTGQRNCLSDIHIGDQFMQPVESPKSLISMSASAMKMDEFDSSLSILCRSKGDVPTTNW